MGASASVAIQEQEARRRSKSIDESLAADREKQARTVKILMLGPCDAGKSTLAKQVRLLHDKGFSDKEKAQYRHVVRANLGTSLLHVLEAMKVANQEFPDQSVAALADNMIARLKTPDAHLILGDLQSEIHILLQQEHFHRFLEANENIGLAETSQYFFKAIDRILSPSFVPSDYDILRARQKSLGLAETIFHFKGFEIRLCDVDGTSSAKKKWLDCFEDVAAVLFTVGLDTYDIRLKEESGTELEESMAAFALVCGHKGFASTPMVLFLNRRDVFRSKLKVSPLSAFVPDYTGNNEIGDASAFLQSKFQKYAEDKANFFSYVTCAIDTPSIRLVFESVLSLILNSNELTPSKS